MTKNGFQQKAWNLKDLILSHKGNEFERIIEHLEKDVLIFEAKRKELKNTLPAKKLIDIIKLYEKIKLTSGRIYIYSELWFSENTKSEEARVFKVKIQEQDANIENRILFFSLWFKSLDEKIANKLIKDIPEYRYFLTKVRMFKPYTLSEAEEKILTIKEVTEKKALNTLYKILTSSFKYDFELDGKRLSLNRSQLSTYIRHKDKLVRKRVYKTLLKKFSENKVILGEIYKTLLVSWKNEYIQLRKYSLPISPRNFGNNISDKAIESMLATCKKNTKVFNKYFFLKSKMLGMKKMKRENIYATLKYKSKDIPFSEGVELVLDAYKSFSPEIAKLAKKIIEEDHLHSKVIDSKIDGAFCYDIAPGITPYILVNYTGKERDITTLAHELGHGVHDLLSHKNCLLQSHPPLILAETASVFGEMLVTERIYKIEKDAKERRALIASKIDDFYATIQRQAFFVLFEIKAHKSIEQGATLEEISQLWLQSLREQFGDSVEVPKYFKYEWLSIPHIYQTPFYCYAYPFGNLLTLALYQMYKEQGKSFVPKYLKFLSYGGSEDPENICAELGINLESEQFWQKGFDFIESLVKKLETGVN